MSKRPPTKIKNTTECLCVHPPRVGDSSRLVRHLLLSLLFSGLLPLHFADLLYVVLPTSLWSSSSLTLYHLLPSHGGSSSLTYTLGATYLFIASHLARPSRASSKLFVWSGTKVRALKPALEFCLMLGVRALALSFRASELVECGPLARCPLPLDRREYKLSDLLQLVFWSGRASILTPPPLPPFHVSKLRAS